MSIGHALGHHDRGGHHPSYPSGTGDDMHIKDGMNATIVERAITGTEVVDPALDRAISRRFDRHILPWIFGIWLFAFLDRSNIGNAKINGLVVQLKLDGTQFNAALALFYVLYILVDIPSNWAMKRVGAGLYLPGLIIAWGVVGACTGFVKDLGGLIAARMLLGLCEGGVFGGIVLYLSMFYKRHELLSRLGVFYCATPLSGAFGGLLAAGLSRIHHGGYTAWPWIFFIEGALTVVFGIISAFFLPHSPATSMFLAADERIGAVQRLNLDSHGAVASSSVDEEEFAWKWVNMALSNANLWLLSLNFFAILVPIYSFSLFLPTIISGLGYTNVVANLFTVPPNILAVVSVLLGCYMSDRIKMRGVIIIVGSCVAIVGYGMLISAKSAGVHYAGTFLVAAGVFPCSPMVTGWLANNLAPHYARATGLGIQVAIGNCSAFLATFTYLSADAPRYITGHAINLGMLGLVIILTTSTMVYMSWENSKRASGARDNRLIEKDAASLGHYHPSFRYTI